MSPSWAFLKKKKIRDIGQFWIPPFATDLGPSHFISLCLNFLITKGAVCTLDSEYT